MFMKDINNIKIFNLSSGKSIPDWLSDQKKSANRRKNANSQHQIELIQDFDMPTVATSIQMTPDRQYIIATGTYKPRVKCFEVSNLSTKFERCFDSEVQCCEILSDDYSKMVFLQSDRNLEFHVAHGRHYKLRIPRFGRDMKYHKASCDLIIVGVSSDIYRLNMERGQFLQPYESNSNCINTCAINPDHNLICVGTNEGTVEAWDSRERKKCTTLDAGMSLKSTATVPSVTSINFKNGLCMGVGTASGHVLLYDIRSRNPILVKNHLNKLPIKRLEFNTMANNVYSLDSAMLKIWDEHTGSQIAYIESSSNFNDFCTIKRTGMIFMAEEDVKMLTYYIPAIGPAPKWCSFLDNLTEEIQSEIVENIYEDYKFITQQELQELNLEHLIGSCHVRAYMHGYFIDHRLYNKSKQIAKPFESDGFRKDQIRKEIGAQRPSRIELKNEYPKVNQDLAIKIMEDANGNASKKMPNLLEDIRFKALFENTDFTIDKSADEYKLFAPALNRIEKHKMKKIKQRLEVARVNKLHADELQLQKDSDNDEDLFSIDRHNKGSTEGESSEDDSKEFSKEIKKAYKIVKLAQKEVEKDDENEGITTQNRKMNKFRETSEPPKESSKSKLNLINRSAKSSLQDRMRKLHKDSYLDATTERFGNKQMDFVTKKNTRVNKKQEFEKIKHQEERKRLIRSTGSLSLKKVNFK